MFGKRCLIVLMVLIVPLFTGCVEKERLDNVEKTQKEIKEKVDNVYEQRLDNIEKTQKEILAKLNTVEASQKAILKLANQGKRGKPPADFNKVHNIPVGNSPVRGNPNAAVTIVEFSDFQCPYCSRLQPTLKQVLEAYPDKVKLVFKDFPLSFHKQAKNASKASFAAREQGKYWEMHDIIFENFNNLNEAKFEGFASKLGLDMEKFMKDFKSNKYDAQIERDIKLGTSIGVRGTPALFMNGKRMGARSFEIFKSLIEGYLKKK